MPTVVPVPVPVHFVHLRDKLPGRHVVCWYGPLKKNVRVLSLPSVVVAFRELDAHGQFGRFRRVPVAITDLGQLRLGSVITDAWCRSRLKLASEDFSVDFSATGWTFENARAHLGSRPMPSGHWLRDFVPTGWMLSFTVSRSRSLWVPCTEFFSRCYGRSQYVKRVLSTYPWPEVARRLFLPLGEPCPVDRWVIRLPPQSVAADAVFVACARYDSYCEKAAKRIYAEIEARSTPERPSVSLRVGPWFQGPATLRVRGLWLGRDTFLALRVDGCSDPPGPPIDLLHEVSETAPDRAASVEDNGYGARLVRRRHEPDVPVLTSDAEPDRGAGYIELQDPDFVVLGTPRKFVKVLRPRRSSTSGRLISTEAPPSYSAGEESSSGNRVGSAHIHAPEVEEVRSEGVLLDMWNALSFLRSEFAHEVMSLCWYTFEHGFEARGPPYLIPLPRFRRTERAGLSSGVRSWNNIPRGVLVVRCVGPRQTFYLVEVQRHRRGEHEEKFSGLVFRLNPGADLDEWLWDLLTALRETKGVFAGLIKGCPGEAHVFNHSPNRPGQVPCEAAARNALSKMGIKLPDRRQ